jgi:flagellar protein FliS
MFEDSRQVYLENQIVTATPQKLRLMLIEGGIRFARLGQIALQENRLDEAFERIVRCREIVAELLAGIRVDQSDLTRQVAAIYAFLFRQLVEVNATLDPQILENVIRVLEEERITWAAVCEQMPEAPTDVAQPEEILAPRSGGIAPPSFLAGDAAPLSQPASFSIDA